MNLNLDVSTIANMLGGAILSLGAWWIKRQLDEQKAREEADRLKREAHDARRESQHEATQKGLAEITIEIRDQRYQIEGLRTEMRTTRELFAGKSARHDEGIAQNRQSIASIGARIGAVETEQAIAKAMGSKRETL